MNKTLTISIGGQLFEIKENAYQQLDAYINSLKTYFKHDADGDEIVNDIEARIAELFIEQQTDNYKVIIKEQVEYVQMKMGSIEDFEPIETAEDIAESTVTTQQTTTAISVTKKLMRDNEDRVLGGVSSGLGYYFNASALLFRLLFLILFFAGPGIIIYLLFWIIVPKATTAADKLLMRGLPINVNTLAGNVKTRTYSSNKLIDFIGQLITYFTKFAVVITKLLLIIIGISLLVSLMAAFGAVFFGLIKGGAILNSFSVGPGLVFWLVKLILLVALGIPIVFICVLMVYLLFNRNYFKANYVLPLAGLWLICTFCAGFYGKAVANDFEKGNIVKETATLQHTNADTLFIAVNESKHDFILSSNAFNLNNNTFLFSNDSLHLEDVKLILETSNSDKLNLSVEKYAKGKTEDAAASRATATNYNWQLKKDTLWLNNYASISKNTKWRKQKIELFLAVPEGKVIHLTNNTRSILTSRNKNIQGIKGYNMNDRTWQMTANGLDCLNCNDAYEKIPQNIVDDKFDDTASKEMFEAINIEGVVDLTIKQGKHKIIVDKDKHKLKPFEYKRKNGIRTLEISTKKNINDAPKLTIWLPNFRVLRIEGASAIDIKDFELNRLEVTAEGAHSINIDDIKTEALILNTEGAGTYKLTGTVEVFELNSEGVNSINAIKLETENATLKIVGAATGKFWATEYLDATIQGPAAISYKGNPEVKKDVSLLSSFSKIK